jgi:adenylate kinase
MDIVLMGPPGVGKGTQGVVLAEHAGLTHVASGDLFRAHIRDETELGLLAKTFVERGELVPDRIVTDMVLDRVLSPECDGTVLDGFPRTLHQAQDLPGRLSAAGRRIDAAVLLTAPRQTLLRRIAGRQTCRICQTAFNVFYQPPRQEALCDLCGGALHTRADDNMETARHRLDVYEQQTRPIAEYYRTEGLLLEVDGLGDPGVVFSRLVDALDLLSVLDLGGVR